MNTTADLPNTESEFFNQPYTVDNQTPRPSISMVNNAQLIQVRNLVSAFYTDYSLTAGEIVSQQ